MTSKPLNPTTLLRLLPAVCLVTACGAKDDGGDDEAGGTPGVVSIDGGNDGVGIGSDGSSGSSGEGGSTADPDEGGAADDGDDDDDGGESTGTPSSPVKLDLGALPDAPDYNTCGAPSPVSCDAEDDDPFHALGINCEGGPQLEATMTGDPSAFYVHQGNMGTFDMPAPFPPLEGEKMLVMSSGIAANMAIPGSATSTAHPGQDPGNILPAPLMTNEVSPFDDCATDPTLVGTGDCSNTLQAQWSQGSGANDYAEVRLTAEVPDGTFGFSYNLAFFSIEYPVYYQSVFNDMYIAWLQSELWTGNISFDEMGNPISLNAGFLDYKDAPNPVDCPAPCAAPELAGTYMEGHAGTKWLTTTAGVTPGETIEVVFAIFDLSDNALDSVVLLDNWLWECDGGPPVTIPG